MKNLKIGMRLTLAFGIVLMLFGVAAGFAGLKGAEIRRSATDVEMQGIARSRMAAALLHEIMSFRIVSRDFLLRTDPSLGPKMLDGLEAIQLKLKPFSDVPNPLVREAVTTIQESLDVLHPSTGEIVRIAQNGDREGALAVMAKGGPAAGAMQSAADKLIAAVGDDAGRITTSLVEEARISQWSLLIAFSLAAISAVVCALLVTRSITRPIRLLITQADHLASGNLSVAIRVESSDEVGQLQTAFARMTEAMNLALTEISLNSTRVETAAKSLEGNARTVYSSIETQSESATAMAAALEEMSTSVDHIADISQQAREASAQSRDKASAGSNNIRQMISQIDAVSHSINQSAATARQLSQESERITSIVQVIKELSDQTNLLALNAAIEAARAGEQGRGFAVVADEVRKLAERTTNSTRAIDAMVTAIQSGSSLISSGLSDVVSSVEQGLEMARHAGLVVQDIEQEAQSVQQSIDEVSLALQEQSAASRDIAGRVEIVVRMVDENAGAAASLSQTSSDMKALADTLHNNVGRFSLREQ